MARVVGRSPIAKTSSPSRALMKVLLPLLYSPTTTRRKSSSISWTREASRSRSARDPSDCAKASRTRSTSRRSSATSSPCCLVRTCSKLEPSDKWSTMVPAQLLRHPENGPVTMAISYHPYVDFVSPAEFGAHRHDWTEQYRVHKLLSSVLIDLRPRPV